jgi:hypothetical protein
MRDYFVIIKDEKKGPITFDELVKNDIYDNTLVWKNGWEDWKKAAEIDELSQYIIKTPPPTPFEKREIENSKRYDNLKVFIKQNSITYFFLSILTTLIILGAVYKSAYSNDIYSDLYPIYLTEEQRNNPSSFLLDMLPTSVITGFVLSAILFAIYYISRLSINIDDNDSEEKYNQRNNSSGKKSISNSKTGKLHSDKELLYEEQYKIAEGVLKLRKYTENHVDFIEAILNENIAPDGKYKLGFLRHVYVEEGKALYFFSFY